MSLEVAALKYTHANKECVSIERWKLPNSSFLLCGPNGCGKSLLASILAREIKAYQGNIIQNPDYKVEILSFGVEESILAEDRYNDESEFIEGGQDLGRKVADLFELNPENRRLVELVGINDFLHSPFKFLSTGEVRKVLLTKVLTKQPDLLILDEPYAGLDIASQEHLHTIIKKLIHRGIQIMLVDFYRPDLPVELETYVLMKEGLIVAEGMKTEVLEIIDEKKEEYIYSLPGSYQSQPRYDSSKPLIELKDVSLTYYDKLIFKDLNWCLRQGEHTKISGPNGCGKSSLLSMLCGDNVKAYGQDIKICEINKGQGESIWEIKKFFGSVGASIQRDYRIRISVLDTVVSGLFDSIGIYQKTSASQYSIAKQWLDLLGMRGKETQLFSELSYGEQRLVLIARAMIKKPVLLILDEPCQGLDNENRNKVLALIDFIAQNSNTTILFVSHDARDKLKSISYFMEFEKQEEFYLIKHRVKV